MPVAGENRFYLLAFFYDYLITHLYYDHHLYFQTSCSIAFFVADGRCPSGLCIALLPVLL